jgi:cytochrome b subunit of formate dehydrogenase
LTSVLFFALCAFAQDNLCLDCHDDNELTKSINDSVEISLHITQEALINSVHEDMECADCHEIGEDHPDDEGGVQKVDCSSCHDDAMAEYEKSVHASFDGEMEAATCSSCHGSHQILPSDDPASATFEKNLEKTCAACHSKPKILQRIGKKGTGPSDSYHNSAHGKLLRKESSESDVPTCITCHNAHNILPRSHPESSYSKQNVAETCGGCHHKEYEHYTESIHYKALKRGHYEAPTCNDCHGEHLAQKPDAKNAKMSGDTKICKDCHSSEIMMNRYGLDHRRFDSYMKSYHGLAAIKGSKEAATCVSCHEVHEIKSSTDGASSVHISNLKTTCGKCHQNISDAFIKIDMHPVDQESRNPIAYFFTVLYTWMLIIVIGGMFVHNIIILVHHIREKRKIENGMVKVARFKSWEVYQHFFMASSFMVLAITGFALKFPEWGWVELLVSLGMDEPVRAFIHRVSAVIMVVVSLIQLAYFVFSRDGRKEILELIPSYNDFKNLIENMAYHLGLSKKHPKFPRYDYAEKAEYLALIWGVIVMAVTGFILWFPELFMKYLPFWVFETAEVIHYYEAWLATLAILVWHWFFVIFHPAKYPLSFAWMDGKITEAEMKEHHPLEYEAYKKRQQEKK